ncbi:hypothetical protein G7046_g3117 [Stylonectria norvegica]|nr:hypothetical protein G7046_g3117 [Stylonectria norvegica]
MSIAIIGAGLSGLSLALALHRQNIDAVLYESRDSPLDIGGAIMLSPNALKILDVLGVLKRLEPRSYKFDTIYFRTEADTPADEFDFGSVAKYGYPGMRVYRYELINILLDMIREAGVKVVYGKKFDRVVSETAVSVTWKFSDDSEGSAPLLVGADGIHSRVRSYLYPDIVPKFTNMIGVTAAVATKQLQLDGAYQLPVTFMNRKRGAFVIAPQLADGSEVLIGKQRLLTGPEPDKEGWKEITSNKEWCIDFLREGSDDYPAIVRHAVSALSSDKVNLWPFYLLPKLDSWTSKDKHGRVIILGDAAHAIPPTAGQGVNQAFEDIYTFAGVMGKLKGANAENALEKWLAGRQGRIEKVLALNAQINQRRLPGEGQQDFKPFDIDWLYTADFDKMVDEFVSMS